MLRGSSLAHARDAFALAQCCTRLMRLFRAACLSRVDGTHIPRDLCRDYDSCFCWSQYQLQPHMQSVIRLAGENLHELHLPPYRKILHFVDPVLEVIADYCPNLHTLSFQEAGALMQPMEVLLVGVGANLRSLSIDMPGLGTMTALRTDPQCLLRELELTYVDPRNSNELIDFIQVKGKRLESLRIVFDALDSYMDYSASYDDIIMSSIIDFKRFLGKELRTWCPRLQSFDIGLYQHMPSFQRERIQDIRQLCEDEVAALRQFLLQQDLCAKQTESPLKRFRISTTGDSVWVHITDLFPLIHTNTCVEIDLPRACVIFPKAGSPSEKPYYRSLQLPQLSHITEALAKNKAVFDKVECIDVQSLCFDVYSHSTFRDRSAPLQTLCTRAGANLKSVRAIFACCVNATPFLSFLVDLMSFAPRVASLEVSQNFVCLARGDVLHTQLLGALLANLRNISLRTLNDRTVQRSVFAVLLSNNSFVESLPYFLDILQEHCPYMEAIYLEDAGDITLGVASDPVRQHVRSAINALEYFASERPRVDVSTIKAQLKTWMDKCY